MPEQRFLIAPLNNGLVNDVRPWLIPDDAFARLNNAYVYRGRVRKRFGGTLMNTTVDAAVQALHSRFRIDIGTTDGNGDISTTVPGAVFKVGQAFSIGTEIFTVNATGTPGTMLTTGSATVATYNTTTGAVVINGAAATTDVYFYPAEPVMGLLTAEDEEINLEPVYGFDTQFAYQFTGGGWERLGTAVWTGDDADFFWGTSWRGVTNYDRYFFVSNFVTADGLKYWDGTSWTTYTPIFNSAGDTIETARCIVPFKDRLVLLNTVEDISGTPRSFPSRCRFSQNGDPTQTTAGEQAFREDVVGKGGYIDAPTTEQIITCQFLKDRLIVFFERSTWELVYTGSQVLPFTWQQINTELGAESTFSQIPFDRVVLGVGNVGVHACNGMNVERIDKKIEDEVFDIHNGNDGVKRVYGIRDYKQDLVYWTFPALEDEPTYPTRVLVYNYQDGSWAFNDDSITCFGYYQRESSATDPTPETQIGYRDVIAGNQEGFVFIVDPESARNAPSLQITDVSYGGGTVTITAENHNLYENRFIAIENCQGITGLNDNLYQIASVPDADTITISASPSGTYTGGGTMALVSRVDILTKQYNFFTANGYNVYVSKVDFMVDRTDAGAITLDYSVSSSTSFLMDDASTTGTLLGDSMLETSAYATVPLEATQSRVWHPMYFQVSGECIQLRMYLSDTQMVDTDKAWADFQLHALMFHAQPTSSRLQ